MEVVPHRIFHGGGVNVRPRSLAPPLKWAGGKRWLARHEALKLPTPMGRYIEPFLGSGAIYFSLLPTRAILSDLNPELINVYVAIRDAPDLVCRYLKAHAVQHCKEYYYWVRAAKPRSVAAQAARTLYLNRTCWNGLYRVNKRGQFNVPIGTKMSVLLDTDDFNGISSILNRDCELVCEDFEEIVNRSEFGDFIFVDPPYTVAHNYNGFIKYNENLFTWDDQKRLKECLVRAESRGANFLVTNASHDSLRELYKDYVVKQVSRAGVIASSSAARGQYEELVITNY